MQQQSPKLPARCAKRARWTASPPQEAAARAAAGLTNEAPKPLTKTAGRIVRDNLCTFFNFVFLALAACCVAVGAYRDTLFLGIVVINALIGIVQELRVKHAGFHRPAGTAACAGRARRRSDRRCRRTGLCWATLWC